MIGRDGALERLLRSTRLPGGGVDPRRKGQKIGARWSLLQLGLNARERRRHVLRLQIERDQSGERFGQLRRERTCALERGARRIGIPLTGVERASE